MSGRIFIPIVTGFDNGGIAKATTALSGLGKSIKGAVGGFIGITSAVAAMRGIADVLSQGVTEARDLERNFVSLDTVFGEFSGKMKMFAKDSAKFGLSASEASKASVFLGSVLKQSGFAMSDTSAQTERLVKLAADLATTYGYDVSEALTGMTALFRGEYDPIEKFGVAMKQAEVNALLLERGQKGLTGATLRNAQAVARLDLLFERAADSMGSFNRQGDSLFVAQKKLDASFKNLQATLGQVMLQPIADSLNLIRTSMTVLEGPMQTFFDISARAMKALGPAIGVVMQIGAELINVLNPVFDVLVSIIDGLMPGFVGLWRMIKVALNVLKPILDGIAFVVKLVSIGVKLLLIGFLGLMRVLEAIVGPLIDGVTSGLGEAFGPANTSVDAFNSQLDGVIAKMSSVDGTSMEVSIDAGYIDPNIKRLLELQAAKDGVTSGGLSDEQKKKLTDIKASIAGILADIVPGPLIKRQIGELESAVVSSFADIKKQIESLVSEGIFNKKSGDALKKYAKTEADVLSDIASRRDKLANRYNLAKSLMAEIKTAVIGFANLSNIMNDVTENVTVTTTRMVGKFSETITTSGKQIASAGMIIDKYRDILGRTKSFKADLEKLQAMKIDTTLYNQILAGGLDGGAAAAAALAQGGQAAVDELNSLFADLSTLGTDLGESTAQMMYGTGLDMADGLLAGILSADEKLKDAAKLLASTFSKAFKAAIDSGNTSGLTVDTSVMESINTAASMTGIGAAGVGRGRQFNVTVNAGIGTDGAAVGKVIVDTIKKYERTSGKVWVTA